MGNKKVLLILVLTLVLIGILMATGTLSQWIGLLS